MDGCLTSAETGFINSQPSMAEFMTALPHLTGELQHPPPPGSLSPPPGTYQGMVDSHGQPPPGQQPPPPGVNVPEYPWMKEKKTTRKSNQQGKTKHSPCLLSTKRILSINFSVTLTKKLVI
jgi:homeobox protein HoxA/B2